MSEQNIQKELKSIFVWPKKARRNYGSNTWEDQLYVVGKTEKEYSQLPANKPKKKGKLLKNSYQTVTSFKQLNVNSHRQDQDG